MMGVVEAVLALIGLVTLIGFIARWHLQRLPDPAPHDDLAAPYREGLHAAIRMQVVAQDLKQQLYAEAIRQAEDGPSGES